MNIKLVDFEFSHGYYLVKFEEYTVLQGFHSG